jgi:UDP-GlcNAc:undecaprenyl-phosphate GlcNAc-1-phosphate transferase
MYIYFFLASFVLSLGITPLIRWLSFKFKILDYPSAASRKIHKKATPLMGGVAVFISFFLVLFLAKTFSLLPGDIPSVKHLGGMALAGLFLMFGGFLDDKYQQSPGRQFIWPVLAALTIVVSGIGIDFINNPLGEGYLRFDQVQIEIFRLKGIPYYFTPWSDLLTFFWLLFLMYATKFLDGLDGLVSGISVIGALSIAGLCLLTKFYQPDVASLALIMAGAFAGFLVFNVHPAKIFLGEGGSLFAGFLLGVLAIISGSKFATTLLILGLAGLDLISVVFQRLFEKQHSIFQGDQKHLHFRLLKAGFSYWGAVLFYWLIALFFGASALLMGTREKVIALVILMSASFIFINILSKREKLNKFRKKV